jgi:hypothetical protein
MAKKRDGNNSYNTNLASEYLIMSLLSRIGKDAYLSLGNKKGVDIVVTSKTKLHALIEVKGVNKNLDWLIGNTGALNTAPNLFYALVAFNGKIEDVIEQARFYIIPSERLAAASEYKIAGNNKTVYLSHKYIRENYRPYLNTFKYLEEYLTS